MAFGSLRSQLNTRLENVTEADMGIFKGAPARESRTGGRLVSPRISLEKKF